MQTPSRILFAALLSSLALGCAANSTAVVATAADDLAMPDAAMPSGAMKFCETQRDIPVGNDHRMFFVRGFRGVFVVALPEATDWKFQCDDSELFWAFSKSARIQATMQLHRPRPGEDVSQEAYLSAMASRIRNGMESKGLRVTNSAVTMVDRDEKRGDQFGLEMTFDGPEGKKWNLFPQDAFFATRTGLDGMQFDLHLTTYFRSASEQAALRAQAHMAFASFMVSTTNPSAKKPSAVSDLTAPREGTPAFAGVSATNFSDKTLAAMKAVLDCKSDAQARYCAALDRFSAAKALSANSSDVWAGSTLVVFAAGPSKVAGLDEGIHDLYVKQGKGSFKWITPSNESEAADMKKLITEMHAGRAPSPSSGLMKYLATLSPQETHALEQQAGSLSFVSEDMGATSARAFVRENDKELLVVEIAAEGLAMKIGIFPKR